MTKAEKRRYDKELVAEFKERLASMTDVWAAQELRSLYSYVAMTGDCLLALTKTICEWKSKLQTI